VKSTDDLRTFQLFTKIGIIEQLSRNHLERNLPDGIKMSQFVVLNHLVRLDGDWSPARLASAFQVTKGAMTNTLQRLGKRGLVTIADDPEDGRAKLISITEAGAAMREKCVASVGLLLADISNLLSEKDMNSVLPILEKIRKFLDTQRS
jgi:DNA-binding MarR family transcriptional regulator